VKFRTRSTRWNGRPWPSDLASRSKRLFRAMYVSTPTMGLMPDALARW
jgi:hypothetical protein